MNLLQLQKLRIKLKAYEPNLLDDSCRIVLDAVNTSETKAVGPIPLPTKRRIFCVLRSPHVYKDSREHFEIRRYKIIVDISTQVENPLVNLLIPAGVTATIRE